MAILTSIAEHIDSMTPQGVSVYILSFLGVILVTLGLSGGSGEIPGYFVVFCMFAFTIWYIYVKMIVPNPLQL